MKNDLESRWRPNSSRAFTDVGARISMLRSSIVITLALAEWRQVAAYHAIGSKAYYVQPNLSDTAGKRVPRN